MVVGIDQVGLVGYFIYLTAYQVIEVHDLFKPVAVGVHDVLHIRERPVAVVLQQGVDIAFGIIGEKAGLVIVIRVIAMRDAGICRKTNSYYQYEATIKSL